MSRWIKASLVIMLVLFVLPAMPVQAQTDEACDYYGTHSNGAVYCITMPPLWNGDLVIFAHGYVPFYAPLMIPWSQMTFVNELGEVIYLPDRVNDLGFAFATTSYSMNGLAVQQGIADVRDLVDVFKKTVGVPKHVYLVGASEGGLVTTLAIEQDVNTFSGGLALCGPIGSFQEQVNYWGDFRVAFDYFMDRPRFNVLPGSAVDIPMTLMNKWDSIYVSRITNSLALRPTAALQLMSVTRAPFVADDLATTVGATTLGILWYNVFATNDAALKLGGQPFDNHNHVYVGSLNDVLLNRMVKRFSADPIASAEIAAKYETTGVLMKPLVTMHTTGDPIVPLWHQATYTAKVLANNPPLPYIAPYLFSTVDRYGHCAFTLSEIQTSFTQLVGMVMAMEQSSPPTMQAVDEQFDSYYYDYR